MSVEAGRPAAEQPRVSWVWSRFAPNPVEHVTIDRTWAQPLCGRPLSNERLTTGQRPSGFCPVCPRCARKAERLGLVVPGLPRAATNPII